MEGLNTLAGFALAGLAIVVVIAVIREFNLVKMGLTFLGGAIFVLVFFAVVAQTASAGYIALAVLMVVVYLLVFGREW